MSNSSSDTPQQAEAKAAAIASEKRYGIPAMVTYAQWKLESANGTRTPAGSNNPFGIKALPGRPYVEAFTTEVLNGQTVRVMARFVKFASLAEAFAAHAQLLATNPAYAKARALENDPVRFAQALTGIYATDPDYGAKLTAIINGMRPIRAPGIFTHSALHQITYSKTHSATIYIDNIHVHTQATDAPGIAQSIKSALQQNTLAAQANSGAF